MQTRFVVSRQSGLNFFWIRSVQCGDMSRFSSVLLWSAQPQKSSTGWNSWCPWHSSMILSIRSWWVNGWNLNFLGKLPMWHWGKRKREHQTECPLRTKLSGWIMENRHICVNKLHANNNSHWFHCFLFAKRAAIKKIASVMAQWQPLATNVSYWFDFIHIICLFILEREKKLTPNTWPDLHPNHLRHSGSVPMFQASLLTVCHDRWILVTDFHSSSFFYEYQSVIYYEVQLILIQFGQR